MATPVEPLLRSNPLYRRLAEEDKKRLAEVSLVRSYAKGTTIFSEGDPSDFLYTVELGRVKEGVVLTEKEGFVLTDRSALERLAAGS